MKNFHFACNETFDVQLENSEWVFVTFWQCALKRAVFSGIARPEKDVCRLADPPKHRNGLIPFPFGRFGFGLSCLREITDVLTSQAVRKHLPSGTFVYLMRNKDEMTRMSNHCSVRSMMTK